MCDCPRSSSGASGHVHEVEVGSTTGETITHTEPVAALQVVDLWGDDSRRVLSGTVTVVVGRMLQLSVTTRRASGFQWTVCDAALKEYRLTEDRGAYFHPTDGEKRQQSLTFAYWRAGQHRVSVTASVGGTPRTVELTLDVRAPVVSRFRVDLSDVKIVSGVNFPAHLQTGSPTPAWLSTAPGPEAPWLANFDEGPPQRPGCNMLATVTAAEGQGGVLCLLQLIKVNRKTWGPGMPLDSDPPPGRCTTSGGAYAIDNAFYGVMYDASATAASDLVNMGSVRVDAGATAVIEDQGRFSDQPCIAIPPGQVLKAWAHDEFHLYLMYKPSSMGSIWAPLQVLYWHWGGTAIPSSTRTVTGKILGQEPAHDPPTPPTWTRKWIGDVDGRRGAR